MIVCQEGQVGHPFWWGGGCQEVGAVLQLRKRRELYVEGPRSGFRKSFSRS